MESKMGMTPPPFVMMLHHSSSRPTLGFPLGTALLLIVIFCISGIFSCCYHWDKLRSLRQAPSSEEPSKISSNVKNLKQDKDQSLPVIMPGDRIPKFMAWPCPHQQSAPSIEMMILEVMPPPPLPTS